MTLLELEETFLYKRQGLANEIWLLSYFLHDIKIKNFPKTPEEAMPNMFPPKQSIKMPTFLQQKWLKRGMK